MEFIGRREELRKLKELCEKGGASLVTVQGRRRIGKSTLIKHFVKVNEMTFYEFQGLAPRPGLANKEQLKNFSNLLANYMNVKSLYLENWSQAFELLGKLNFRKKSIVLLDEISWMGGKDLDFAGKLKQEWDRHLVLNPNLILILCGSVSSWIEKNILKNTGFVGRVSLELKIKEFSFSESYEFLSQKRKKIPLNEFAQILSFTGGVPRYLEEINPKETVENNLKKLCFQSSGFLFSEFDKTFSEIFGKKSFIYQKILEVLEKGPHSPAEVALTLKLPLNGDFVDHITDLELGGFICRDFTWSFSGKESRLSQLRISDNYVRFYIKYILPRKARLEKKSIALSDSLSFLQWSTVFGFQFENMILNNMDKLIDLLQIPNSEIIQLGPYFQTGTKSRPGVQIDFLIQCKKSTLHLCEIKSGTMIGKDIIKEVQQKIKNLKKPKGFSIRPYLIYLGEISEGVLEEEFFDKVIPFKSFVF